MNYILTCYVIVMMTLLVIFIVRCFYFSYRYEMRLLKKHPEKAKDFGIMPGVGFEYNGFRALINLLSKEDLGDAELFRLKALARNSIGYILICMLAIPVGIVIIMVIKTCFEVNVR